MFGGAIPDLSTTPCPVCGESVDANDIIWDPYHRGDRQFSALPHHPACAQDLLPPAEPALGMRACGICGDPFPPETLQTAFSALHQRFRQAKPDLATPEIVWRLAGRDPRAFVAEHFACLLGKV